MSLLPVLLRELMEELPAFRSTLGAPALRPGYLRPWYPTASIDSGLSLRDNEFKVRLDVTHFKPEELKVRLDDDGHLVVEGKHEERSDAHGFISRQFVRRYRLPDEVVPDSVQSNLSSDGVLTLKAAMKPSQAPSGREIPIVKTDHPALKDEGPKADDTKAASM